MKMNIPERTYKSMTLDVSVTRTTETTGQVPMTYFLQFLNSVSLDEAFSHMAAGLSKIKKEGGVRTRHQCRQTEDQIEIVRETEPTVKTEPVSENATPPAVSNVRKPKKEPYPQRLCSNPIAAINEYVTSRCSCAEVASKQVCPI